MPIRYRSIRRHNEAFPGLILRSIATALGAGLLANTVVAREQGGDLKSTNRKNYP